MVCDARAANVRRGRGAALARFEMGSTIVLISPPGGPRSIEGLELGEPVRLGQAIGSSST